MKLQIFKKNLRKGECIFLIIATILISILTYRIYSQYPPNLHTNLLFFLLILLFLPLFFLAYKDFKTYEVDYYLSLLLLIFFSLLNIILFLVRKDNLGIQLTQNWYYDPYQNLLGGFLLGSLFQLVVLATKEKALGQGDVRIALLCGLILGFNNLILWVYITIFSALAYGLIIARKRKKFKGTKVPFLPFMILGIVGTILYLV